jgi:hypothetical protein
MGNKQNCDDYFSGQIKLFEFLREFKLSGGF